MQAANVDCGEGYMHFHTSVPLLFFRGISRKSTAKAKPSRSRSRSYHSSGDSDDEMEMDDQGCGSGAAFGAHDNGCDEDNDGGCMGAGAAGGRRSKSVAKVWLCEQCAHTPGQLTT